MSDDLTAELAAELTDVRARLAYVLDVQCVPVERDAHGDFAVRLGSATTTLRVAEDGGAIVLDVRAALAVDVPLTPELHRYAAEFTGLFGRMAVEAIGDGVGRLVFAQQLLADPMSPEAVMPILSIVANTADELDDEVVARFGGRRGGQG